MPSSRALCLLWAKDGMLEMITNAITLTSKVSRETMRRNKVFF
jgi:hypothetical protein